MAAVHKFIKARFSFVRQDLDEVLARLKDSDLLWSPAEGMRTIADQLLEIANKEKEVLVWLQVGTWLDDGDDAFDLSSATVDGIRVTLSSLRVQTFAYIDSLTEAQLDELVPCAEGWWEALRLTACPRGEILRNIAAHEWYHTGQLLTYLWMRGDDPNAW